MGRSFRNGLRILIDVTPFEGVVRIIVRAPLFILGDDEVSPLSAGGAIKQQSASVNVFLRLCRCEVMRDDSWPFRVLTVIVKGRRTVSLEAAVSEDHFRNHSWDLLGRFGEIGRAHV